MRSARKEIERSKEPAWTASCDISKRKCPKRKSSIVHFRRPSYLRGPNCFKTSAHHSHHTFLQQKHPEKASKGEGAESLGLSFLGGSWEIRGERERAPAGEVATENLPPVLHAFRGKVFAKQKASCSHDGQCILCEPHTVDLYFSSHA